MTTTALSNDNTIQFTAAQTSREVKKHLKKMFPHMEKLSVTCKNFSLRISWLNGPSRNAVESATKVFAGTTLEQNGGDMIKGYKDLVEYNGKQINFGIDYIFCERTLSPENEAIVAKYVQDKYGEDTSVNQHISEKRIWDLIKETDANDFPSLVWAPVEATIETIAIEAPATVEATIEDVTTVEIVDPIQCECCGWCTHPKHTQIIHNKTICQDCIEKDTDTLTPEDIETPTIERENTMLHLSTTTTQEHYPVDEQKELDNGMIAHRYSILSSLDVCYTVWVKLGLKDDYQTYTYEGGHRLGDLTTRRIGPDIDALPRGNERSEAVQAHYRALEEQAERIIRSAFPEDFK